MQYGQGSGHPPDFEVSYRFFTPEESGRRTGAPFQHYRCDWSYEGDDISQGIYTIWPEFLSEAGAVLPEGTPVPLSGRVTMWIASSDMRRQVHRDRLKPGVKGFFVEGPRRVAEAIVTRIIGLSANSDSPHEGSAEQQLPVEAPEGCARLTGGVRLKSSERRV